MLKSRLVAAFLFLTIYVFVKWRQGSIWSKCLIYKIMRTVGGTSGVYGSMIWTADLA